MKGKLPQGSLPFFCPFTKKDSSHYHRDLMIRESIGKSQFVPHYPQQSFGFASRICTFMIAATDAIHQLTLQTTRSIQFTASAIINLNFSDLENAFECLSLGLLQAVGLLALGILGLFDPASSRKAMEDPYFRQFYPFTKYCTPVTGKILCAIHAATYFPCNIILGVNALIATPFKDDPKKELAESKIFFCKALIDIIAIPGGFFSEDLRQSECIEIT